ncbi:MAG: CPBP family intramembrane glutamic endopeptidase [Vicinamibacterales bacterium]
MPDRLADAAPDAAAPVVPAEAAPAAGGAERRRPGVQTLAVFEVVAASGFPTQLALGALLMAAGLAPFGADGRLSMTYMLVLMPADMLLVLAIVVWRIRAGGERVPDVLLGRRRSAREGWLGIGLVPVVFGGAILAMLVLRSAWPALHNVDANPFEGLIQSPLDAAVIGVLVVLSGGLKEEVQRAFVLHRFDQHLGGARLGLVLYSLVFGTGHIIQGYDVAIVTALLGLAWGTVFLWRRSLVAPAVSHAGFNAAQILQFLAFGA